jgi:hypothetical protein
MIHAPVVAIDLNDGNFRFLQRLPDFLRQAVNKLGAEFDGKPKTGIEVREYAAANSVAGFENRDREAGLSQRCRCCEARDSGPDDDYLCVIGH